MSKIHYISSQIDEKNDLSSYVKEKYDFVIKSDCNKIEKDGKYPIVAELLYKYICKLDKESRIVVVSENNFLSASVIAAMNEKYLVRRGDITTSELKIIYIDCLPDLDFEKMESIDNIQIASLMNFVEPPLVSNKLILQPEQIFYVGLNEKIIDDEQTATINELEIINYTMRKINKNGIDKILKFLDSDIGKSPVHITIDFKAINKNGLLMADVEKIIERFKKNLVSIDFSGLFPESINMDQYIAKKTTGEIIKKFLISAFELKEKAINIFTEDSKFLIYRPADQDDNEFTDVGWYILRTEKMSHSEKDKIIKSIDDETIITIDIDGQDYLVAKTSIADQQNKSFYTARDVKDMCLLPSEKINMVFDLIN